MSNRLDSNVQSVRIQMKNTLKSLDDLIQNVNNTTIPIQQLTRNFRLIKNEYDNEVTKKIRLIKKEFAKLWVEKTRNLNLNSLNKTTNVKNFKSYLNIKINKVSVGENGNIKNAELSKYPKFNLMKSVLESLDKYIAANTQRRANEKRARANENRARANEARARNAAARTIQRAQREKSARNEARRVANANRRNLTTQIMKIKKSIQNTQTNLFEPNLNAPGPSRRPVNKMQSIPENNEE